MKLGLNLFHLLKEAQFQQPSPQELDLVALFVDGGNSAEE
jgi:hypothetical protein